MDADFLRGPEGPLFHAFSACHGFDNMPKGRYHATDSMTDHGFDTVPPVQNHAA